MYVYIVTNMKHRKKPQSVRYRYRESVCDGGDSACLNVRYYPNFSIVYVDGETAYT